MITLICVGIVRVGITIGDGEVCIVDIYFIFIIKEVNLYVFCFVFTCLPCYALIVIKSAFACIIPVHNRHGKVVLVIIREIARKSNHHAAVYIIAVARGNVFRPFAFIAIIYILVFIIYFEQCFVELNVHGCDVLGVLGIYCRT